MSADEEEQREERLHELNHLVVLETGIKQTRVNVLTLASQDYSDNDNFQVHEAGNLGAKQVEEQRAKQNTQAYFMHFKASVSGVAHLNAPEASWADTQLYQVEELCASGADAWQQAASVGAVRSMVKPAIAKKPKIIGSAAQYRAHVAVEQLHELGQDSRDMAVESRATATITGGVSLQKSVASTVQNMALAVASTVRMLHEDLGEMESVPAEESAIVIREDTVAEKAINDEQERSTTVQSMALAMTSTVRVPHEDLDEMEAMPTEESAFVIREDTVTEKAINDEQDKTTMVQNMALAVTLNVNMIHEDLDEMEAMPTEESAFVIREDTVREKAINGEQKKSTMVQNMALAVTSTVNMLIEDSDEMGTMPTSSNFYC